MGWWVWLTVSLREQVGGGSRKTEEVKLAGEDLFISVDHVVD